MTTSFSAGETVRINTPGESHHKRTGIVVCAATPEYGNRLVVGLGGVQLIFWPDELMKEKGEGNEFV